MLLLKYILKYDTDCITVQKYSIIKGGYASAVAAFVS